MPLTNKGLKYRSSLVFSSLRRHGISFFLRESTKRHWFLNLKIYTSTSKSLIFSLPSLYTLVLICRRDVPTERVLHRPPRDAANEPRGWGQWRRPMVHPPRRPCFPGALSRSPNTQPNPPITPQQSWLLNRWLRGDKGRGYATVVWSYCESFMICLFHFLFLLILFFCLVHGTY